MIKFKNPSTHTPFIKLKKIYDEAVNANQERIEVIAISSYSNFLTEVNSRYVNLKIIDSEKFIFFSNYESVKSDEFSNHKQISALLYWDKVKTQIRIKGNINKTSSEFNNEYFSTRSPNKNALAISSKQSKKIDSYDNVKEKYRKSLKYDDLKKCPNYWGGYYFIPYYFEFWVGHEHRLNRRDEYTQTSSGWSHSILEP